MIVEKSAVRPFFSLESEVVLATIFFPADKTTYTLYEDERYLISEMDGRPVVEIKYDTNYLFAWEGDKTYRCYVKDIPVTTL